MRHIKELRENERVIEHYLCREKQTRETQKGKTYYSLKLQDSTGSIEGKVWELSGDIQSFEENDVVKVDGIVTVYQNELQLKISKLRRSSEGEFDPKDYIACSKKDVDDMYSQIVALIESIVSPYMKALLENILIKNEVYAKLFKTHSAAKQMHHSYMGGLLEHTLSVAQICDYMSSSYKYINRDIAITGALLHDIGKIFELSPMPQNEYTNDGQLLGHIVMGVEMIAREAEKIPDFPHDLATLIKHTIISHHGEYEFGSTKLPYIAEAMLLHYADNMDAKLKAFEEILDNNNTNNPWAGYQRLLSRYIRSSEY